MRTLLTAISVLLAPWSAAHIDAAEATYDVAEAKSSVRIHVGRSGAFSFVGHKHEVQAPVSGTVTADPANLSGSSVDLTFASARLHVMPEGEPTGDAPKVEAVMRGPAVLDVIRFSEIRFRSTKVTGRALAGGGYDLVLVGELSLHGVTREITLPVQVTLNGRSLAAAARTKLRHDQFGLKPVTAGGGLVKVANEIQIEFQIVAEQR